MVSTYRVIAFFHCKHCVLHCSFWRVTFTLELCFKNYIICWIKPYTLCCLILFPLVFYYFGMYKITLSLYSCSIFSSQIRFHRNRQLFKLLLHLFIRWCVCFLELMWCWLSLLTSQVISSGMSFALVLSFYHRYVLVWLCHMKLNDVSRSVYFPKFNDNSPE